MEIRITGEAKEIAALVLAIQERQNPNSQEFADGIKECLNRCLSEPSPAYQ